MVVASKGDQMVMRIAVLKERQPHEHRVAATPETVKKLTALGAEVTIETGAGAGASIPDADYAAAGAKIGGNPAATLTDANLILKVQKPLRMEEGGIDEAGLIPAGARLVGMLSPHQSRDSLKSYADKNIEAMAMELMPRITRAQSMDVLSSQANLAGYRAVLEAAAAYGRSFPLMMTAAGTAAPARVLVMGAGVAGLQAIATARRLGAVVSATDVRPAAKEQVQSLGATFVAVEDEEFRAAEAAGGYAKEMSAAYQEKQAILVTETLKKQDIVITTALIPGRPAPKLLSTVMVEVMKPGAVIVDLAVEQGGNCALSKAGETVHHKGVAILGPINLPGRIAEVASQLYAKNLLNFVTAFFDKDQKNFHFNPEDEIIKAVTLTRGGTIVHPQFENQQGGQ